MQNTLEVTELRIGNLIWDFEENRAYPIEQILKDSNGFKGYYVKYRDGSFSSSIEVLEPIPLSEKYLVDFGFEKDFNGWYEIKYFTDCELAAEKMTISYHATSKRFSV